MTSPNEAPNEYTPEDFGGYVCGYVQQRISGAFELDYVPSALFDLSFQGAYRVDVVLAAHTGAHLGSVMQNSQECTHVHRPLASTVGD